MKPDDLKRNDIDLLLKKLKITNNTRRKYLLYVRMFFSWVKTEGHISQNPTDGIKYKVGDFNGAFYSPKDTKKLLRYVAEKVQYETGRFCPCPMLGWACGRCLKTRQVARPEVGLLPEKQLRLVLLFSKGSLMIHLLATRR